MTPTLFVTAIAASMIDPVALVGYVAAGVFFRKFQWALVAAAAWATAVELLTSLMALSMQISYVGQYYIPRVIGGCIAASIVFLIARKIRAMRSAGRNNIKAEQ